MLRNMLLIIVLQFIIHLVLVCFLKLPKVLITPLSNLRFMALFILINYLTMDNTNLITLGTMLRYVQLIRRVLLLAPVTTVMSPTPLRQDVFWSNTPFPCLAWASR